MPESWRKWLMLLTIDSDGVKEDASTKKAKNLNLESNQLDRIKWLFVKLTDLIYNNLT